VYCNECVSSIRHLLHFHLSPFPFRLPLSLPICVPFPIKCFCGQFTGSKVLISLSSIFSPRFPSPRAPLHTRRARVYIYIFFLVSFFFPSLEYSQHFLSSPSVSPSFSLLSVPLFFFFSFPPCRAHNCIIERLLSQLTLSLSPFCHIPDLQSRYVHICRSRNRIVLFVHMFTAERNEENNVYRYTSRLGYTVSSNQEPRDKLERAPLIYDKNC